MGETVEALTAKADVPGRMKGYVGDKKDAVTSKLSDARDAVTGGGSSAGAAGGTIDDAKAKARRGVGVAKENPLGLALGGLAAGFLIGSLLPSTEAEDERLGPIADHAKEQVRELGSEAAEHGTQMVKEVAEQTADAARESAREHGDELRATAVEHTR
jgi:hypothetical protein